MSREQSYFSAVAVSETCGEEAPTMPVRVLVADDSELFR